MRKSMTALAAVFVFTACDGNPFLTETEPTTDPTTPDTSSVVPETLANNLTTLSYDEGAGTVTVSITGLDTTPIEATYTRNAAAEAGLPAGYQAYSIQEDPLDRLFVALVSESNDGTVRAGAVADGGQFNRFFSGAHYERDGDFDPPDIGNGPGEGQVSYAGSYVGLDNWSGPRPTLPPGTDPSIQMAGPGRVTGQVFINANFADMQLNGSIFNRQAIDLGFALDTIVLLPAPIADDGTFFGDIELDGVVDNDIGDYGGIFGGVDASSLGGTLVITNYTDLLETESETGIFVLTQCGMAGEDAALCAGTAP